MRRKGVKNGKEEAEDLEGEEDDEEEDGVDDEK